MITDCHVHIEPMHLYKPEVLAKMRQSKVDFQRFLEMTKSPRRFLQHLDHEGVERAALINCVAPEVMGTGPEVNEFVVSIARRIRGGCWLVGVCIRGTARTFWRMWRMFCGWGCG